MTLVDAPASHDIETFIDAEVIEDPNDLSALDKVWMDQEVLFGPAASECGRDELAQKMRAATRAAPDMPILPAKRPVMTTNAQSRT